MVKLTAFKCRWMRVVTNSAAHQLNVVSKALTSSLCHGIAFPLYILNSLISIYKLSPVFVKQELGRVLVRMVGSAHPTNL